MQEDYLNADPDESLFDYLENKEKQAKVKPKKKFPTESFITNALLVAIPIGIVGVIVYIVLKGNSPITAIEYRIGAFFGMLYLSLIVVALFMVRNAVVTNTKFILTLKKAIIMLDKSNKEVSTSNKQTATSISKQSNDTREVVSELVIVTSNLLKIIKKNEPTQTADRKGL
jgi:hypothetical protein